MNSSHKFNSKAPIKVVVLISGSGSNLQALIDKQDKSFQIVAVGANRFDIYGLSRAQKSAIPSFVIEHSNFSTREAFDRALIKKIETYQPDLVVLAGFMRILSEHFVQHYAGRLLNIHPSLLPKYKGTHTHQRVLEAGEIEHGCTVHYVTPELDGGPAIIQAKTWVLTEDTLESLKEKVQHLEHLVYPLVVSWYANDRLALKSGQVYLDNVPLGPEGFMFERET